MIVTIYIDVLLLYIMPFVTNETDDCNSLHQSIVQMLIQNRSLLLNFDAMMQDVVFNKRLVFNRFIMPTPATYKRDRDTSNCQRNESDSLARNKQKTHHPPVHVC